MEGLEEKGENMTKVYVHTYSFVKVRVISVRIECSYIKNGVHT